MLTPQLAANHEARVAKDREFQWWSEDVARFRSERDKKQVSLNEDVRRAERDRDMLVILNNDIVVTPGWAATVHRHMQHDASIGLIGPVTNNIGNEAKIDTAYESLEAMQPEQRSLTGRSAGKIFDIRVLAFFCVAMPRDVFKHIGALDENFGTGFFEDDDYCQRVRQLNRRIVCAEDVFVHHELSASFGKLPSADRQHLFDRNKAYYESKWGPWQRHVYRPKGNDQNAAAS